MRSDRGAILLGTLGESGRAAESGRALITNIRDVGTEERAC